MEGPNVLGHHNLQPVFPYNLCKVDYTQLQLHFSYLPVTNDSYPPAISVKGRANVRKGEVGAK